MKKLLALILAMLMLMATLAGCGEDKEKDTDEDAKPSVSQEKDDSKPEKEPEKKDESKDAVKVTDALLKAMLETGDGELLVNALPERLVEEMLAEEEGATEQDLIDVYSEMLELTVAQFNDVWAVGEEIDLKISWAATDTREMDKDEIEAIKAVYEDELGVELDIATAIEVEYEMTVELEGEKETQEFVSLIAIKVDGKWCIDLSSFAEAVGEM